MSELLPKSFSKPPTEKTTLAETGEVFSMIEFTKPFLQITQ